jgi:hypothetical protein
MDKDITIYGEGIVCCSVCVPKDMSLEDIENGVNERKPTGVDSKWHISKDEKFADGIKTNPCECDQNPNRKHYLLNC